MAWLPQRCAGLGRSGRKEITSLEPLAPDGAKEPPLAGSAPAGCGPREVDMELGGDHTLHTIRAVECWIELRSGEHRHEWQAVLPPVGGRMERTDSVGSIGASRSTRCPQDGGHGCGNGYRRPPSSVPTPTRRFHRLRWRERTPLFPTNPPSHQTGLRQPPASPRPLSPGQQLVGGRWGTQIYLPWSAPSVAKPGSGSADGTVGIRSFRNSIGPKLFASVVWIEWDRRFQVPLGVGAGS